ncbi:MAG TPA: hypothetical protein VMH81_04685 [Bryobacteraceae bacterium]|nr:hypothetical protein [Bryobacteraceae bacterium]
MESPDPATRAAPPITSPLATDHGDAVSVDRFEPNPAWSPGGIRISYTECSRKFFPGKLNVLAFDQSSVHPGGEPGPLYGPQ